MQYKFKIEIIGVSNERLRRVLARIPGRLGPDVRIDQSYLVFGGIWDGKGPFDGYMLICSAEAMELSRAVIDEIQQFCSPQSIRAYAMSDLIPVRLEA